MKFRSCFLLLVMAFVSFIPACNPRPTTTQASPTSPVVSAGRTLPALVPTIIAAPNAEIAARVFLNAWKGENYPAMYQMLTPTSQDALTLDSFTQRYKNAMNSMMLKTLNFEILSKLTNPSNAQVAFRVTFHTTMLGDFTRDITMNLSLVKDDWRVQWDDGLIMPELHGGNALTLDLKSPTKSDRSHVVL